MYGTLRHSKGKTAVQPKLTSPLDHAQNHVRGDMGRPGLGDLHHPACFIIVANNSNAQRSSSTSWIPPNEDRPGCRGIGKVQLTSDLEPEKCQDLLGPLQARPTTDKIP